jgi:hypothetical protein
MLFYGFIVGFQDEARFFLTHVTQAESKLSKNSADLKPVSTALNKFKKRKNLFSFRVISASQSLGHLGRMSGALCDLDER